MQCQHWASLKSIQNETINAYLSEHLISVELKTGLVLPIPKETPRFNGTRRSRRFMASVSASRLPRS